jgi:hypothetical protein
MCSNCPKRAAFGPAGGRAHRCGDCRIEGDVDVVSAICSTCLAFTASYGSKSEGARRCAGCRLPGDVSKLKRLCRTCFKNRPEFGPTPRKKPTTCETCKIPGLLHRDSDWLWNMLVTRKPRKGEKKHKILWSEETLRDLLWWLKPQGVKKEVKQEVKAEPGLTANVESHAPSESSSRSASSAAAPRPQLQVLVKIEPGTENGVEEMR